MNKITAMVLNNLLLPVLEPRTKTVFWWQDQENSAKNGVVVAAPTEFSSGTRIHRTYGLHGKDNHPIGAEPKKLGSKTRF